MKLEREEIFFINALDAATGVIAKDCLIWQKSVTYVVKDGDMGRAIGAKGSKIKELTRKLGRKVELVGFYQDIAEFFRKAMPETEFGGVKIEGELAVVKMNSTEKRKIMQNAGKFKRIKKIAERNYNITGVKVR